MKLLLVGVELFHENERTDKQDEAYSLFFFAILLKVLMNSSNITRNLIWAAHFTASLRVFAASMC